MLDPFLPEIFVTSESKNDRFLINYSLVIFVAFVLGTFHGVSRKYLQNYLDEFCYRFNRRLKESELHQSLLRACVSTRPRLTYLC